MLYVTQCAPYRDGLAGVHGVLDQSAIAMHEIATAAGLTLRRVRDVTALPVDELAAARVIALFTIGETPWSAAHRATIVDNVRAGRTAVVAIHAATDSCYGWDDYGRLVGARFDGHPWTQEVDLEVVETDHPATRHLGSTWRMRDEVYQFRDLRPDARVLLRVPEAQLDLDAPGAKRPDVRLPAVVVLRRGQRPGVLHDAGPFPDGVGEPRLSAARGRRAAPGRAVPRRRNFSPWQQFLAELATVEPVEPLPLGDLDALHAWKRRFPARLEALLGPLPERVPLDLEVESTEDCGSYRRDRIVFDVERHLSSPAWLLVPHDRVGARTRGAGAARARPPAGQARGLRYRRRRRASAASCRGTPERLRASARRAGLCGARHRSAYLR